MPRCCGQDYDGFFHEKAAARELARYRKRGARGATARLLAALDGHIAGSSSLLDIGGGVGVIQHELAARGIPEVMSVDASAAYHQTAGGVAKERGYTRREFVGDFVELAEDVPQADIVTLDKVICCYPEMPKLVGLSAHCARRVYAIVVPRDGWFMRLIFRTGNLVLRLLRREFRTFIHRHTAIDRATNEQGLALAHVDTGLVWVIRVYERASEASAAEEPAQARGMSAS